MIPIIIALVALSWFLVWAIRYVGVPTSISSLYYESKIRWTYTLVISGIGALMTFVAPYSLIHWAGVSLILGTAAPHFRDVFSLSKLIHFGLTGATALLAVWYVGGVWMGLGAVVLLAMAKLVENDLKTSVFWAEAFLFYGVFLALIFNF